MPAQYCVVYEYRGNGIIKPQTKALVITAEDAEEAVNIPLFREGKASPTLVFPLPGGPGEVSSVPVRTVGTQQWRVE